MAAATGAGAMVVTGSGDGVVSGPYRALGHHFHVGSNAPHLAAHLAAVLADLADPSADVGPSTAYRVEADPAARRHRVLADGEEVGVTTRAGTAVALLLWHVNRSAVRSRPDLVVLHAAVAARDGVGVVLPAEMEAGKTTLVAGLVAAGFDYLSDELAAVDPRTFEVHPYPKPLSVDPGSWEVLAPLRAALGPGAAPYSDKQWQLPAGAIRPGAVGGRVPVALVVAPRYREGAPTRLEPATRAEMLHHLVGQTFGFDGPRGGDLEALAGLLRGAGCYRLTVGDLWEACAALNDLVTSSRRGAASRP